MLNVVKNKDIKRQRGFTLIELLVVMVIIGVLAFICVVAYNGVTKRATKVTVESDASGLKKALSLYNTSDGKYPNTVGECTESQSFDLCADLSPDNSVTYKYVEGDTYPDYCVSNNKYDDMKVCIDDPGDPPIVIDEHLACPKGFISVPGSATYYQGAFCVMKYEAKKVGATAVSQPEGRPWVEVTQIEAVSLAQTACEGCHLITEAEWMTIAQNVAANKSNWSGRNVGSGYIYNGHNDIYNMDLLDKLRDFSFGSTLDDYLNASEKEELDESLLPASDNDSDGYYKIDEFDQEQRLNTTPYEMEKRTLKLSNNETIWDFAGNAKEWTTGSSSDDGPDHNPAEEGTNIFDIDLTDDKLNYFQEWNRPDIIRNKNNILPSPFPIGTSIPGAGNWDSKYGIGTLIYWNEWPHPDVFGFARGGGVPMMSPNSGIFSLQLAPDTSTDNICWPIGFRVTMTPQ